MRQPRRSVVGRVLYPDGDAETRVHRAADWSAVDAPDVARLLHRCDILAIKIGAVLDGTGFSERWTRVLLDGAERSLGRGSTEEPPQEPVTDPKASG